MGPSRTWLPLFRRTPMTDVLLPSICVVFQCPFHSRDGCSWMKARAFLTASCWLQIGPTSTSRFSPLTKPSSDVRLQTLMVDIWQGTVVDQCPVHFNHGRLSMYTSALVLASAWDQIGPISTSRVFPDPLIVVVPLFSVAPAKQFFSRTYNTWVQ